MVLTGKVDEVDVCRASCRHASHEDADVLFEEFHRDFAVVEGNRAEGFGGEGDLTSETSEEVTQRLQLRLAQAV